ncbi:GNAT family N-acetyltransferase [Pseudoduganella umbonata]|uniref:GNAT family N-acetyltransferase n=1 Tax=Pseudoduganella umbonata TaxID=864828 RepID=A0A4P8HM54_9BURK|nr:GNAT family N-acetyltransferase [Pseudoduganella umbonata]MBB3225175.1 GNAT superfamily N-acetyltransferase [Pseudoduganella umbonata]QCP09295.1 GNAT family N-acetyltransferase [Pseudoduganella umbonata]
MQSRPAPILMRKDLDAADAAAPPGFPAGVHVVPFDPALHACAAYALLAAAHPDRCEGFDGWWGALSSDAEYDPETFFIAIDGAGDIAALAICWSVPFVKDLVVAPAWRCRGLSAALMRHAFAWFAQRGHRHVGLKVDSDNPYNARALYRRLGMLEVTS